MNNPRHHKILENMKNKEEKAEFLRTHEEAKMKHKRRQMLESDKLH